MKLIEAVDVSKKFDDGGKEIEALKATNFSVSAGEFVAIIGPSGSGKSTLLTILGGLQTPTTGKVQIQDKPFSEVSDKKRTKLRFEDIGFILQASNLVPFLKVRDQLRLVNKVNGTKFDAEKNKELMEGLGIEELENKYPSDLSGGQRQRICIAHALSVNPKLVICDEPVSALDVSIQAQIINLLKKLQQEMNLTYLFISHDLSVVKFISDKIGVMYLGSMVEFGTKEDIFSNPLHPYTQALFSAIPQPDPDVKMNRIILKGDIPSPANPPKGCRFHTRCPKAMDICKEKTPEYKDYGNGHCAACHLLG